MPWPARPIFVGLAGQQPAHHVAGDELRGGMYFERPNEAEPCATIPDRRPAIYSASVRIEPVAGDDTANGAVRIDDRDCPRCEHDDRHRKPLGCSSIVL